MFYIITLYRAIMAAFIAGLASGEEQESAVLVKINPFISKSRRIIQFGGDGRFKRNGPEKSALYLEFPESFFEDPKLKRLYKALIGGGNSKKSIPEKTDIVFQIDPSAFSDDKARAKHGKRHARNDDFAAFQLTIAPAAAHVKQMKPGLKGFVPRDATTKSWCLEAMPQPGWNPDPVMKEGAQESSTELVAETMCHPSKPSTPKLRICGGTTTEDYRAAKPNDPCQCHQADNDAEQQQVETTPYDLYTQCKSRDPIVTHYVESLCFTTERCSPKKTFMPYAVDLFSTTYKATTRPSCLPSSTCSTSSTCSPFQGFFRRRRKDNALRNFFVLSNSPQSCPPFCPPKCSTSAPRDCNKCTTTTKCSTTCRCPDTSSTCGCPDTPTTCGCPDTTTTCKPTCLTTSNSYVCPKVKPLDDPLRNVLRLFRRRNLRRVRRNPPPFRRRRRIWVYKPKHGFRKVNFRTNDYDSSMK